MSCRNSTVPKLGFPSKAQHKLQGAAHETETFISCCGTLQPEFGADSKADSDSDFTIGFILEHKISKTSDTDSDVDLIKRKLRTWIQTRVFAELCLKHPKPIFTVQCAGSLYKRRYRKNIRKCILQTDRDHRRNNTQGFHLIANMIGYTIWYVPYCNYYVTVTLYDYLLYDLILI